MLDVGNTSDRYAMPDGPFESVRRTDPEQHRYLLGDRFEGIGFEHVGAGAQLTPPRQFVCEDADRLQPVSSTSFFPLHSLAEGGLAGAWGAGAPCFVDSDFAGFPIGYGDLAPHYEAVAARIGINGARDDLWPFLGQLGALQPPVDVDHNGATILRRYDRARQSANRQALYLGRPRLAMLTQPLPGRAANKLWDNEFWSDTGRSVYRPRWTVDELRPSSRFELVARKLVVAFTERDGMVEVTARDVDTGKLETHRARTLVLGAGTLGTTRIVLRSIAPRGRRVPIVCNPHTYMPMLNVNQLGKPVSEARHSLSQVCLVHAPNGPERPFTVAHLYSYRSLLMFRLMKDAPLPHREGLEILRHLSPSLAVMVLQHADAPTTTKYCELSGPATGDERTERFTVEYAPTASEQSTNAAAESAIARALLRVRCIKLRAMQGGHAASTHFAGTLPMSDRDEPLTTDRDGKLRGTRAVYVVDGSVFPKLPSKGLTFTMMANANRIASVIARRA